MSCPVCQGSRWVCEAHPRLSWPEECNCTAGMPCPTCNVAEPPAMPAGFFRNEFAEVGEAADPSVELTRISGPALSPDHPGRPLASEESLEPAFQSLASAAQAWGWSQDETAFALLRLALAHIQTIEANLETDEAIARAIESAGSPETQNIPRQPEGQGVDRADAG